MRSMLVKFRDGRSVRVKADFFEARDSALTAYVYPGRRLVFGVPLELVAHFYDPEQEGSVVHFEGEQEPAPPRLGRRVTTPTEDAS